MAFDFQVFDGCAIYYTKQALISGSSVDRQSTDSVPVTVKSAGVGAGYISVIGIEWSPITAQLNIGGQYDIQCVFAAVDPVPKSRQFFRCRDENSVFSFRRHRRPWQQSQNHKQGQ